MCAVELVAPGVRLICFSTNDGGGLSYSELSRLATALLKAEAARDKAAEEAARAAIALAMEAMRETTTTKGLARLKRMAERAAAAARKG
jgi:hypothetical protein